MRTINNNGYLITTLSNRLLAYSKHHVDKSFFLNIFNAIASVSFIAKEILSRVTGSDDAQSHKIMLYRLKEWLLPHGELLPEETDDEVAEVFLQGHEIMRECEKLTQQYLYTHRPICRLSLSSKTAIIGGLLLAGGAAAGNMVDLQRSSDIKARSAYYRSADRRIAGIGHRYEREAVIPDEIKDIRHRLHEKKTTIFSDVDSLVIEQTATEQQIKKRLYFDDDPRFITDAAEEQKKIRVKRSTHDNMLIPNRILHIIQNENLHWKVRDELYLIFRKVGELDVVKKIKSPIERNIMLLVKYLQLAGRYLYDNENYSLHNNLNKNAHAIFRELLCIIGELNEKYKVAVWQIIMSNEFTIDNFPIKKMS